MQKNRFPLTRVAAAVAGLTLALGAGQAFGAAFALQTQSGSGLGNAYAGGAASAEDASTVWSNPAGMARFSTLQIVGAGNIVAPSIKFHDDGSLHAFNQPLGGTGGDAGSAAFLPALYLVVPINQQFAFGLGVNVPFGLETEWDDGWLGRYQALHSKVETINVNPALSWRIVPNFTVGVGASWQKVKATLTSNANYSAGLAQGAQQAAAAGFITPATAGAFIGATGGLDSYTKLTGERRRVGLEHRRDCGTSRPTRGLACTIARRSSMTYPAMCRSTTRHCRHWGRLPGSARRLPRESTRNSRAAA